MSHDHLPKPVTTAALTRNGRPFSQALACPPSQGKRHAPLSDKIDQLFAVLTSIHHHAWTSQWPAAPELREKARSVTRALWQQALQTFSPAQLERGIQHCLYQRTSDFPPSLPEFRRLCLPTARELGLPEEEQAYQCALRRDWQHPAIWHAVNTLGEYELRRMDAEKSRQRFIRVYRKLVQRCMGGESLSWPTGMAEVNLPQQAASGAQCRAERPVADKAGEEKSESPSACCVQINGQLCGKPGMINVQRDKNQAPFLLCEQHYEAYRPKSAIDQEMLRRTDRYKTYARQAGMSNKDFCREMLGLVQEAAPACKDGPRTFAAIASDVVSAPKQAMAKG